MNASSSPSAKPFAWPEALVIDIVAEQYVGHLEPSDIQRVARLHGLLLRHLFENNLKQASIARKMLVAECERAHVETSVIGVVDRCAFWEIANLIQTQLRPTSRTSGPIAAGLHAAICRIGTIGMAA